MNWPFLFLLAFVGLFRLGELIGLKLRHIDVVSNCFCLVTLQSTKTNASAVTVIVRDATLIRILAARLSKGKPSDRLCNGNYRDISLWLRKFAYLLSVPGDRFIGHGFRRGGATHMFRTTGSLDRTQMLGRWACAKTCRQYIDDALAERSMLELPPQGKEFITKALRLYPSAMNRLV